MTRGLIIGVCVGALVAGCRHATPTGRQFVLQGQVLGLSPDVLSVRIAHEEIPGLMQAMTMSFAVKDLRLLEGLQPGDVVRGTLVLADNDVWLSTLERMGHKPIPDETLDGEAESAGSIAPLEPGQPVADAVFVDQDDKPFAFSETRGKAVALTFIYTRCPLPTFCPLLDRHFRTAQQLMAKRADLRGRTQLLSVTFDPAFDTPAVLRQHAAAIEADLASWRFLSAPKDAIDQFATRFGVYAVSDEGGAIVHNMRTAVVGPDGRLRKILDGAEWTAEELVAEMAATLQ